MSSVRNTVYALHTRRRLPDNPPAAAAAWHPQIAELKRRDYAFLGCRYREPGFLFRGLSDGLYRLLEDGSLRALRSERPQARLEAELGVLFVSHEPADALALARPWEASPEAAVVVLAARVFNQALACGEAAVLGLADPGMVFRYPFFACPPDPADIGCVIAGQGAMARAAGGRLRVLGIPWAADRRVCEHQLRQLLVDNGIAPSEPLGCTERP